MSGQSYPKCSAPWFFEYWITALSGGYILTKQTNAICWMVIYPVDSRLSSFFFEQPEQAVQTRQCLTRG